MKTQNNNQTRRLANGMLAIMLLLGSGAMAEGIQDFYASAIQPDNFAGEILGQGESALAQLTLDHRMANNWHYQAQDALTSQLQRPTSDTLFAIEPDCAEKKSPLANRQALPDASATPAQLKG